MGDLCFGTATLPAHKSWLRRILAAANKGEDKTPGEKVDRPPVEVARSEEVRDVCLHVSECVWMCLVYRAEVKVHVPLKERVDALGLRGASLYFAHAPWRLGV